MTEGSAALFQKTVDSPGVIRPKKEYIKPCETCFANTLNLNDKGPSLKWVCFPKSYSSLANWPWLRISPQSALFGIYCLILTAWQWSMSFTCIPVQTEPNKSPLRKRLLALLLWEIGHLSSPGRSCLGRLIPFCGSRWPGRGGEMPYGWSPPHTCDDWWERTVSQAMLAAFEAGKYMEMHSPLEPPEEIQSCQSFYISPMKSTFGLHF